MFPIFSGKAVLFPDLKLGILVLSALVIKTRKIFFYLDTINNQLTKSLKKEWRAWIFQSLLSNTFQWSYFLEAAVLFRWYFLSSFNSLLTKPLKKGKKRAKIFVRNDVQNISMVIILESFYLLIIIKAKLIKA